MEYKKSSLGKNAFILTLAAIIVKILGAIYRIPVTKLILDEGIGYYQSAYPIYDIMLAISTAGLPVAVATLVSSYDARKMYTSSKKVFNISVIFMGCLGLILALVLLIFSKNLVDYFNNPNAYYAVVVLVPAMIFSPILASLRGYYQGKEMMTPTAISQTLVQLFRMISGLLLIKLLLSKGISVAAGGASAGAGVGALVGLIYMIIVHVRRKSFFDKEIALSETQSDDYMKIFKTMIKISIPISIGAAIIPIMDFIDIKLVMSGLINSGFSIAEANMRFGWLKGMAQTLINFPQVLAVSIGVASIPVLSGFFSLKKLDDLNKQVSLLIKIILLIGIPCMIGLFILSYPIISMLYSSTGEIAVTGTTNILKILSLSIPFIMIISLSSSILQSIHKERIPVYNIVIGAILKIIVTYILTNNPEYNIYGAAIGTVLGFALTSLLDLFYIYKILKPSLPDKILMIIFSSVVMGVGVYITNKFLSSFVGAKISCVIAVVVGMIIYGCLILITKSININDLKNIRGKNGN